MKQWCICIGLLVTLAGTVVADPDDSIMLYQSDEILSQRVGGEIEELAAFMTASQEAWAEVIPSRLERKKTALVIAMGSDRESKAWIMGSETSLDAEMTSRLQLLKKPYIRNGCMAFAVVGTEFEQKQEQASPLPIPEEWRAIAKQKAEAMTVDSMIEAALPKCTEPESLPDGYIMQLLEPLGGKILRPTDWYYNEQHGGSKYMWTISKEDSSVMPYKTGIKIQMFSGIREGTGKTPEEFCNSFLNGKANSTKVLQRYPEMEQYLFRRKGIEVEEMIGETAYHIIYSAFWLESDMVVITVSGAPVECWEQHAHTFELMSGFELIDMKRFEVVSANANLPIEIEVVDCGTYSVIEETLTLMESTDQVPAVLGQRFGFQFRITGDHEQMVPITVVYRFPKMVDPDTGEELTGKEVRAKVRPGNSVMRMVWGLTEPWEVVPGDWEFQILQGDRTLIDKTFTVVTPL